MAEVIDLVFPISTSNFELPDNPPPVIYGDMEPGDFAMHIVQIDGKNGFGVPIAPVEVEYSNMGLNWTEINRDGRLPYLVHESNKLPTISFTLTLAKSSDPYWDATGALKVLKNIANSKTPVKIRYGGHFESSLLWRCSNFSFRSIRRHPNTQAITRAEVDLEFKMVQDVIIKTGPVGGGADNSGGNSGGSNKIQKPNVKNAGKRKYKVKKGDTLHKLSYKFYKKSRYWRYLADINKIKNPKYDGKLTPGKIIKY